MKRLLIIIPAFNEARMVGKVVQSLPKSIGQLKVDIVVVDDGSTDGTADVVNKLKVKVLRHVINRGLGAALATGFVYSREHKYDCVVTFDADGQHRVEDIAKIVEPLVKKKADVVIGSRLLKDSSMPFIRKIINWLSNLATYIFFGIWTTDSQSGLRGFSSSAISKIIIKSQKMEVSSEIFKEIKVLGLKMVEIPVATVYTRYSLSKGQRLTNAPNVIWKLIMQRFG